MHPLAARLMSRIGMGAAGRPPAHSTPMVKAGIGLDPSNPLLPPVHNLRMIYLKEPLTPAEKHLHAARVALRELKKTNNPPNRTKLYEAMAKLQGSESDVFARRYIARKNQVVLHGWNTEGKQEHFKRKITQLITKAHVHLTEANTHSLHQHAIDAADEAETACTELEDMNNQWYAGGNRINTSINFGTSLQDVNNAVSNIQQFLRSATALAPGTLNKAASIASIKASLISAKTCQRLAQLVVDGRWDLPYDLRP